MNQMLKPSETIPNKAVLVRHSPNNSTIIPKRAKTQAGRPFFALFLKSPACTPYYQKALHGSAISNAKQHSSHANQTTIDKTSRNEGKNEEMRGMTAPALQLYKEKHND